ncbi:hypothetical protein [Haloferax sp. DFSO60]|uniref:DUF7856 family protein n=1 Tax=Haloferax sp. DFSO60 TaxID=3388652 RepID=UPI00397B0CC7
MKIRLLDGTVRTGRGIDLLGFELDAETVADAVRDEASVPELTIDCPAPGPGHETLGVVSSSLSSPGNLFEAVGRSRGESSPADSDLARLEARRRDVSTSANATPPDLDSARQRVAETGADVARLREETAALRGRLTAHREAEDDGAVADVGRKLRETTTKLSEVETERIAAEQRLSALEREARGVRDQREERLKLEDALDNRRRESRAYFSDRYASAAEQTAETLADFASGSVAFDSLLTTLACIRLADLDAPVVLACDFFDDAETAAAALDTPVIRL